MSNFYRAEMEHVKTRNLKQLMLRSQFLQVLVQHAWLAEHVQVQASYSVNSKQIGAYSTASWWSLSQKEHSAFVRTPVEFSSSNWKHVHAVQLEPKWLHCDVSMCDDILARSFLGFDRNSNLQRGAHELIQAKARADNRFFTNRPEIKRCQVQLRLRHENSML